MLIYQLYNKIYWEYVRIFFMVRIKRTDKNASAKNLAKRSMAKNKNKLWSNLINLLVFLAACILAGGVAFKIYLTSLPPIRNLDNYKPNIVTQFYSADGEVIKTFTAYSFKKIDIQDVPEDFIHALIATEDKNFYKHDGYDITGLVRSTVQNVIAGRVVQGASTITQQLARILFLSNERTFDRKIRELVVAARIEKSISKDKILEMYMNNVYLGSGAYGVEAAAQTYFNKHLNKLSLPELALIAGLPQAPSVYSPFNNMELAVQRRNQVLLRMYKMRYITKEQYEKAKEAKVRLTTVPRFYTTNKAPYFCDYVMKELEKLGFDETDISQGGYKITTTIDYKTQDAVNNAILKNLNNYGLTRANQQAAVFVFSPIDGRILAYAGGKDYTNSQFDRVQAIRPSGSAFKPFVYAAAMERGISPNDMIEDSPIKIGDWAPRNYAQKYRGNIPVYSALMVSSNVCAVRLIQEVGIRAVIQVARNLGISTPLENDYTIALGSNGVKLFELTRAYGAFANGGYVVQPYAIERIETSRGKVIYRAPKTRISRQLSLKTAAEMTAMMKTVIERGTGAAANIGKPAAGKTGTTDDYKDASFVGYTPNVAAGVWVGNDDNSDMKSIQGGTVPALIWRDIMKVATEPYGKVDFNYPEIELKGFQLKPGSIKIYKEDEHKEHTQENTEGNSGMTPATTPAEAVQNFKKQNTVSAPVPVAAPIPAQVEHKPAAAPIPIPMAVPEGMN